MHWCSQHIEAIIALLAVLVGPAVAIIVAKLQIKASLVSANRQAWINDLRRTLADYMGKQVVWSHRENPVSEAERHVYVTELEQLQSLLSRAEMLLNPDERGHQELSMLINLIGAELLDHPAGAGPDIPKLIGLRRQVINASWSIFKQEWEKIKRGK